jgi:hypothetical protein
MDTFLVIISPSASRTNLQVGQPWSRLLFTICFFYHRAFPLFCLLLSLCQTQGMLTHSWVTASAEQWAFASSRVVDLWLFVKMVGRTRKRHGPLNLEETSLSISCRFGGTIPWGPLFSLE